jgi:hypothetical protein
LRHDLTSTTAKPITNGPSYTTRWDVTRAGPMLAAAWFTLAGWDVSWPLEPSRFDLVVSSHAGTRRIQVKTTTARAARTWKVYLSTSGKGRRTYGPDEIDDFFVIDGDLDFYLIPAVVVAGVQAVHLSGLLSVWLTPVVSIRRLPERRCR